MAYYDIVLFGREKQGLTTLADKLLYVANTDPIKIHTLQSAGPGDSVDDKKCELRSNEITKIRVVDVPGFSGYNSTQLGILRSNSQIIQSLGSVLEEFQLHVRRIVYFIPSRGPYEKADGATQEELKLLCHYFGEEVFDCMVVAATNPPQEAYQKLGFDDEDNELTRRAFHVALKSAVDKNIACPPIVYIAYKDSPEQTLQKIRDASVQNKTTVPLRIKDVDPLFPDEDGPDEIGDNPNGVKVHPSFGPKYNRAQRILGLVMNAFFLGIFPDFWLSYWSEKVCTVCHRPLDTEGCTRQ